MRILFTLNRLAELTGSELYTYDLLKELTGRGFEIDVVTNYGGAIYEELKENVGFSPFESLPQKKYDLLHVMHPEPTEYIVQSFPGIPAVSTIHGMTVWEQPAIPELIDHYIAVGPEVKNHLMNQFAIDGNRITVISNGIDLERFIPDKSSLQPEIKTIVWPSTLDFLRVSLLERLIATVSKRKDFRLIIAGEGDYKQDLIDASESNERIIFEPATREIEKLYRNCQIVAGFVFGRVIIEGLACGKAGLVCLLDGSAEFVRKNNFKKVLSLAFSEKKIENILDDYHKSCYKDSRKIAEEHFDLKKNVDKIVDLYASVLKRRSRQN